jgi:hypothetical protein
MVASKTSWSFAAAVPAFARARRSSCRAPSVPAAAFQPRGLAARFHAPAAPVLTDLPREAGDALPSNIYIARFFRQYPGPNLRFLKISATRLLQDLNCYVEVARKEGINRTARELHVAWDDLKRRMPAAGAVPRQPAFVELVTPQMQSVPECTLEVEGRRGKLRIQLKGASASYLATLSRELVESAS